MPSNETSIPLLMKAEEMILLAEKIIDQHSTAGPASPLNAGQVADINYKVKHARDKHEEALKYRKLMEAALQERDRFLGLSEPKGGVRQTITDLVRVLHDLYSDNRCELAQWGLDEQNDRAAGTGGTP